VHTHFDNPLTRKKISRSALFLSFSFMLLMARLCAETVAPSAPAPEKPLVDAARNTLAWTFAKLIEDAIPAHYDKQKDWGKTKNITVGLRNEGFKLKRLKKPVKHGVWKHYEVWQVTPDENLHARIENLRTLDGGRVGFTLVLSAKLDLWARAKVYQYGVHLIALEVEGQTGFDLAIDCEVGARLKRDNDDARVAVEPKVHGASLTLHDFRLNRVSDAKGPLVRELSKEIRKLVERELQGPKLTAKLNRAIEKKRDRLEFSLPGFVNSSWWPLSDLPDVERALKEEQALIR
jgi:hypothetical protein